MSIKNNNKHRYEYLYEMNKDTYIRFAKSPFKEINDFKSYGEKYCYLRATMDFLGIEHVIKKYLSDPKFKKLWGTIWLAWGHKSKHINYVGVGDFTYPKERK